MRMKRHDDSQRSDRLAVTQSVCPLLPATWSCRPRCCRADWMPCRSVRSPAVAALWPSTRAWYRRPVRAPSPTSAPARSAPAISFLGAPTAVRTAMVQERSSCNAEDAHGRAGGGYRQVLALTWAAGHTRPRMGTDAFQPGHRLPAPQRDGRQPRCPQRLPHLSRWSMLAHEWVTT